jgi:hypothetical protein
MNDALSLVQKSFDGIIGQVVANLAPAITAIAEEFLQFVEGFQGIDGVEGGSGIANAITGAFLDAIDFLAGWGDVFITELRGWVDYFNAPVEKLSGVFEYFNGVVDLLEASFFGFRGIVDGLIIGAAELIKRIPGSGFFFNKDDIEAFQDGLGESLEKDFKRAGDAFFDTRPAAGGAGQRDSTTLQDFANSLSEAFAGRNSPENIEKREKAAQQRTFDRLNANFANTAAKAAEVFGDEVPEGVASAAERVQSLLTDAFSDSEISEEEQRAIVEAQNAYNQAIREGKAALDEAAKEQKRREAEEKRRQDQISKLNERFAEKSEAIERDRLDSLSRASNEALQGNDLRTSAGISQFLALATGREDPAIGEYRKQLKELQDIKREIAKANAAPVDIVGA